MIRSLLSYLALGLVLAVASPSEQARSSELVHFRSAPVEPTEFLKRRAKAVGKTLSAIPGAPLDGYLIRPDGPGRFPAVILLHGCAGIFPTVEGAWAERFASWGYVALIVDSFRTRGIKDTCMSSLPDRPYDAYGALDYLASLPFVESERIALVGFSAGGLATLQTVQFGAAEVLLGRKFRAAVAFYPPCKFPSGNVVAPTLILVGELDDWTPAKDCRRLMDLRSPDQGNEVTLVIYPGAYHAFDAWDLRPGRKVMGHWIEYNDAATRRAIGDVRSFLQRATDTSPQ